MSYREAVRFIAAHHRHRRPPRGYLFAIGLSEGEKVVGCAVVGRPIARLLDDSWTAEVTRLCTDGTKNACSMLYSASWRAVRAMGYRRLVTYTLASESGASLRAAGWKVVAQTDGHSWTRSKRPRVDLYPLQAKLRWEAA